MKDDDLVLIPRGWLGAAASAIDKQREAPVTLVCLREAAFNYPGVDVSAQDVLIERRRQVAFEGWTPEHDDLNDPGCLAAAASAYALYVADELHPPATCVGQYRHHSPEMWPFDASWWKPTDPRRSLVKAGALILAEIERLDREASKVSE